MKKTTNVIVTALKAPWPEGAKVGSVVAFKGAPPAWAAGKFGPAPEDAKADFTYEPAEVITGEIGMALPSIDAVNAEVADLQAKLAVAEEANDELAFKLKASESALSDLQVQHEATVKAADAQKAEHDAALGEMRTKLAAAEAAATKGKAK